MTYGFQTDKFWQKLDVIDNIAKMKKAQQEYKDAFKNNTGFVKAFNKKAENALHKMFENLSPDQLTQYIKTGEVAMSIDAPTPCREDIEYYHMGNYAIMGDLQDNFIKTSSILKEAQDAFSKKGISLYNKAGTYRVDLVFAYDLETKQQEEKKNMHLIY
jgi:hypothetical protein